MRVVGRVSKLRHLLSCLSCPLQEELVLPLGTTKRSFLNGLCCLTFGLVVFMVGLVLASIYAYRYYFVTQVRIRVRVWIQNTARNEQDR